MIFENYIKFITNLQLLGNADQGLLQDRRTLLPFVKFQSGR